MALKNKVVIVYKHIPQYRYDFFCRLRDNLVKKDVELVLVYGQPNAFESAKGDTVFPDWGIQIKNIYFPFFGRQIVWQPCLKHLMKADLVIVEQAGKLVLNYFLIMASKLGFLRVAYWGHGKNFQDHTENCLNKKIKHLLTNQVDWWFCYNDLGQKTILERQVPQERITVVYNAIDTKKLYKGISNVGDNERNKLKHSLGIKSDNIGIFIGGMYAEKRLEFLLQTCERIRSKINDFEMIFIGNGVDAHFVETASKKYSWLHYVGPKFSDELYPYLRISSVQLMPGAVGLCVLDSFAAETPLITTDVPYHGPEIDYLIDGYNGIIVAPFDNLDQYAEKVANIFSNKDILEKLKEGCFQSRKKYTVENMASRFTNGIISAVKE